MPHPIRKKMKRREIPRGSRFITFSCEHRLPLLGHPAIRDLFVDSMARARLEHPCDIIAWVVMPEHAHLLLLPRDGVLAGDFLAFLKSSVAEQVIARWRELDAPILRRIVQPDGSFQYWLPGGGFDRNVRTDAEFTRHIRYIHRNPVRRGLVEKPEHWKWSSIRWWMGQRDGEFPCDPPPGDPRSWEGWRGYV